MLATLKDTPTDAAVAGCPIDFYVVTNDGEYKLGSAVTDAGGKAEISVPENFKAGDKYLDAGSYVIKAVSNRKGEATDAIYVTNHQQGDVLQINPRQIAYDWGNTTFTYTGTEQGPGVTSVDGVSGETLHFTLNEMKIDVNLTGESYTRTATFASVTGGNANTLNYDLTNLSTQYVINPKEVACQWGNSDFVYNGNAQGPEATAAGMNGETLILSYNPAETVVGTYTRTANLASVTGGQAKTENYILTGTSWPYTIAQADMQVSAVTGFSGQYTGTQQGIVSAPQVTGVGVIDATWKYGTMAGTYNLTSEPKYTDAGRYTVYYQITDDNHKTLTGSYVVQIDKKQIAYDWTMESDDSDINWDESKQGYQYTSAAQGPSGPLQIDGVNGEKLNFTLSSYANNKVIGDYSRTATFASVTGGQAKTANYDVTPLTIEYKIVAADILVNEEEANWTGEYDGNAHGGNMLTATTAGKEPVTWRMGMSPDALESSQPLYFMNAGTYTVYFEVSAANHNTRTGSYTVTITPKKITIDWDAAEGYHYTYNGAAQGPTAVLTMEGVKPYGGMAEQLYFSLNPDTLSSADAGNYSRTIVLDRVVNNQANAANYEIVNATINYVIDPYEIVYDWTGENSYVYTGESQGPDGDATRTGVNGETVQITLTDKQTVVGSGYTRTASIESVTGGRGNASNYILKNAVSHEYAITPATLIVNGTDSAYNGAYDGDEHNLTGGMERRNGGRHDRGMDVRHGGRRV